jgi:hypothetical protein
MQIQRALLALALGGALSACSTTGTFVIPDGTELEVYKRPVQVEPGGQVTTTPFFWTAAGTPPSGGVQYRLLKNGQAVKEGRLRAQFRVVSIFWPPMALLYWPMGLNPNVTYDLVKGTQE